MRHEVSTIIFTVNGSETERPAIVLEQQNGHISLKLLTGRSGSADIAKQDLDKLATVIAEARDYLTQPKLAADDIQ